MIYMDNAATTMTKPKQVIDAVVQAMTTMGNAGRGAHAASLDASRTIYGTRDRLARFLERRVQNKLCLRITRQRV